MHFSPKVSPFLLSLAIALARGVAGAVFKETFSARATDSVFVVSDDEFMHWLATTDAKLTFVGEPIIDNPLATRSAQNTKVTYCNTRSGNVCGGSCTVFNGGATCLSAPGTNCIAATNDVAFCNHSGCSGTCNDLSQCGVRIDNGFCFTPGTNSIVVSTA